MLAYDVPGQYGTLIARQWWDVLVAPVNNAPQLTLAATVLRCRTHFSDLAISNHLLSTANTTLVQY